jgi:ribosomal peptide maturation radical SAM protein 1
MAIDVACVNLPFAPTAQPSLAFSIFKPILDRAGFTSIILYPNLHFAKLIGRDLYEYIANYQPKTELLLGELLFSQFLNKNDLSEYFNDLSQFHGLGESKATKEMLSSLSGIRGEIFDFIDSLASTLLEMDPRVICFSSLFQQHTAALSLAKALRAKSAEMVLVMGGSNCEGEMGQQTAGSFETLDFVVSGPGELVLPKLLSHLLLGSPPAALDGVFPTARHRSFPKPPSLHAQEGKLDDLPFPDFDSYLEQLHGSFGPNRGFDVLLPIETSRGCWWGIKSHCTFCGLNGSTMHLRQKSPDRAFQEFRHMRNRYPGARIIPVDNILPHSYFKTLLPRLAKEPVGNLFYEVKANLKYEQLRLLKDANIVEIQPGIESLSDAALTRMRKGVSALQNVLLLRHTKEIGLRVFWNMLFGFPGEAEKEYLDQIDLCDSISHLPPPIKATMIRVDRFSPLYFEHRALGISRLHPVDAYFKAFPNLSNPAVEKIAYFFDAEYPERNLYAALQQRLRAQVDRWQAEYPASYLAVVRSGDVRVIVDTRVASDIRVWRVTDREELLLTFANGVIHRAILLEHLNRSMPNDEAEALVAAWILRRFLLEVDDKLVSLVELEAPPADVIAALVYRLGLDATTANAAEGIRVPVHGSTGRRGQSKERPSLPPNEATAACSTFRL